jgi:hypothetical protein
MKSGGKPAAPILDRRGTQLGRANAPPTRSRGTTSLAKPRGPTDAATPITARTITTRQSDGADQNSFRVGAGRVRGRTWAGG